VPDHIETPRQELLHYEGVELILDGSDPATYTMLEPSMDVAEACGRERDIRRHNGRARRDQRRRLWRLNVPEARA
jgi:hypothetical protein